jgi:hypothetical protein
LLIYEAYTKFVAKVAQESSRVAASVVSFISPFLELLQRFGGEEAMGR